MRRIDHKSFQISNFCGMGKISISVEIELTAPSSDHFFEKIKEFTPKLFSLSKKKVFYKKKLQNFFAYGEIKHFGRLTRPSRRPFGGRDVRETNKIWLACCP